MDIPIHTDVFCDDGLVGKSTHIITNRELKDRWGILAYSISGLKALKTTPVAQYRITVDDIEHETDGITCLIDYAGNICMQGMSVDKAISVSDRMLM